MNKYGSWDNFMLKVYVDLTKYLQFYNFSVQLLGYLWIPMHIIKARNSLLALYLNRGKN
jgi:hypothetical protein